MFANFRLSHLQGFVHILLSKICRPAASCTVALDTSLRNHSQDGFVLRSGPFWFEPLKLTQKIKTDRLTYPFQTVDKSSDLKDEVQSFFYA